MCIILHIYLGDYSIYSVINTWCKCAGGLRYLSCVCVCPSVCVLPTYHSNCRFYMENKVYIYYVDTLWGFRFVDCGKRLSSKVMA